MGKQEYKADKKKRFAQIWAISRIDAGKTQDFMAKGLGISKKTVQNWENGVTAPDFFMGSEWFRVLGINPLPYYLSYVFPVLFADISPNDSDDSIEQALILLIKNSTPIEKRELLYLMAGRHGSSWYSLLQMFTAHCHTSMKSRVGVARNILENFEIESATGQLVCETNVMPDIEMLRNAISEGKKSVIAGNTGYTNVNFEKDDNSEQQS